MNGILYFLVGGAVACAIVLAFLQKQDVGKISSTDVAVTLLFVFALAAAAHFLTYSRWGRRLMSRLKQKQIDEDDRVRTNARAKGEVRTPPLGPLP
jgi:ABC-type transport system involved in cytochrome bd biosynthesis fused ATPase/permease subunit